MIETVHVVWGESRADSVRQALRVTGCDERVVALSRVLNLGPIDPLDDDARGAWFSANTLADDGRGEAEETSEAPWRLATAADVHPVFWLCRSDAAEHASFLAFAARMVGRDFDVVDATGFACSGGNSGSPIRSLAQLRPEELVARHLIALRRPHGRGETLAAAADWARLQRENAPLRVVEDGRLVSAPLEHYDSFLCELAPAQWEMTIALVVRAFDRLLQGCGSSGDGASDGFFFARILALGRAGALELRGAGPVMRDYEVRAPA